MLSSYDFKRVICVWIWSYQMSNKLDYIVHVSKIPNVIGNETYNLGSTVLIIVAFCWSCIGKGVWSNGITHLVDFDRCQEGTLVKNCHIEKFHLLLSRLNLEVWWFSLLEMVIPCTSHAAWSSTTTKINTGFSSKSGKAYLLLKYLVELLYQVIILGKLSFSDYNLPFQDLQKFLLKLSFESPFLEPTQISIITIGTTGNIFNAQKAKLNCFTFKEKQISFKCSWSNQFKDFFIFFILCLLYFNINVFLIWLVLILVVTSLM